MGTIRQFKKMFVAHMKVTFREKQAWFWSIFFPVILMVIFMLIWGGNSEEEFSAKIVLVDENPNPTSALLSNQLESIPAFEREPEVPVTREEAERLVKEGDVDAAVILPERKEDTALHLVVNREDEQSVATQAIISILNEFVQRANLYAAGAEPIYRLEFASISAGKEDLEFNDFILTGMIALGIAQGGLFGMAAQVDMRRKGVIRRLRMTPAKMGIFGLSDMAMRMVFSIIQILLLSFIGVLFFKATLHIDPFSLLVMFFVGTLSFHSMGYLLSALSKTMDAYMAMANILSFFMMFLSGVIFPIDLIPEWLLPVSNVLPLTYFADGMREGMIYARGIESVDFWAGAGIIGIWGIVSFFAAVMINRKRSRRQEL